jgi:uncharacterized protein
MKYCTLIQIRQLLQWLDKGTDALIDVKGKYKGESRELKGKKFPVLPFIIIIVIILVLISKQRRRWWR